MEQDEQNSTVVEEQNSQATEELATPSPYKHPSRNLMDKEVETTATEESKEETDEKKPKEDRPVGVEDAAFKKRYDDLKRHYDETISKHKDEVLKLKKEKEAVDLYTGAVLCILNTLGISWQACAGHALDSDWLCHWLSSGPPWLSWTPALAN